MKRVLVADVLAALFVLGGALAAGCSDPDPAPPTGGAGGTGGTGGAGGAGGDGGAWTLDNVCARFAKDWCAALSECCEDETFHYDAAGCEERYVRESCQPMVDRVRADGHVFFYLDLYSTAAADAHVEECIATWRSHFDKCGAASAYDAYQLDAEHNVTCHLFGGDVDRGGECEATADCAKTFQAVDEFVRCAEGVCTLDAVGGVVCNYGTLGCGPDERCDAPIDGQGICVSALDYGEPCEPDPQSDACGFIGYCNPATALCTASKGWDEPCASSPYFYPTFPAHECQSLLCESGRCSHPLWWHEGPYYREVSLGNAVCNGAPD